MHWKIPVFFRRCSRRIGEVTPDRRHSVVVVGRQAGARFRVPGVWWCPQGADAGARSRPLCTGRGCRPVSGHRYRPHVQVVAVAQVLVDHQFGIVEGAVVLVVTLIVIIVEIPIPGRPRGFGSHPVKNYNRWNTLHCSGMEYFELIISALN